MVKIPSASDYNPVSVTPLNQMKSSFSLHFPSMFPPFQCGSPWRGAPPCCRAAALRRRGPSWAAAARSEWSDCWSWRRSSNLPMEPQVAMESWSWLIYVNIYYNNMVISINIYGSWLISINIYIYILIIYPQVRAGPLRKDFRLKKVSEIIFPGGALESNLRKSSLWS